MAKKAWAQFAGCPFPQKKSFDKLVYASILAACAGVDLQRCTYCTQPLANKKFGTACSEACAYFLCGACEGKMEPVPLAECGYDFRDMDLQSAKGVVLRKVYSQLGCKEEYERLVTHTPMRTRGCGYAILCTYGYRRCTRDCHVVMGCGADLGLCTRNGNNCKRCVLRQPSFIVARDLYKVHRQNPPWASLENVRRRLEAETGRKFKRVRMIRCPTCPVDAWRCPACVSTWGLVQ